MLPNLRHMNNKLMRKCVRVSRILPNVNQVSNVNQAHQYHS